MKDINYQQDYGGTEKNEGGLSNLSASKELGGCPKNQGNIDKNCEDDRNNFVWVALWACVLGIVIGSFVSLCFFEIFSKPK